MQNAILMGVTVVHIQNGAVYFIRDIKKREIERHIDQKQLSKMAVNIY